MGILTVVGLKILGALVIWIVARWLIRLATSLIVKAMDRQRLDATIAGYVKTGVGVLLNIALVVALLGFFGVETTTFAALIAGCAIAIGAAWGGLLSNFAAGVFLVILRPFKVGDFVCAGGVTGTVRAIGLFGTNINSPDNVMTLVGNSKVFSDTVLNYSANPYRRVDLTAQLGHSVDVEAAIGLLRERLGQIPNVLSDPAPDVELLQFNPAGPVLAVRPYCSNAHYWQVYFDTNRLIQAAFTSAGYPVPAQQLNVKGLAAAAGSREASA